jgi:hypothetical protein
MANEILKNVKRNRICEVLLRDSKDIWRSLFSIEGDKSNDPSLYIIKNIHINPETTDDEERLRNFSLQKSYHFKKDKDGLIQTHLKRDGHRFGIQKQKPLNERTIPISVFHNNNDNVEAYPERTPGEKDIKLTIKPDFINFYEFIFFTELNGLSRYLSDHDQFLLHQYELPLKHLKVNLAVSIHIQKLKEIQSNINL